MSKLAKCLVCGDDAVGYNYQALTCVSCRTFFIRNASKIEKLKCLKDGKCSVDVVTRRSCSYCRYRKCLSVGMKLNSENLKYIKKENDSNQENTAIDWLYLKITDMISIIRESAQESTEATDSIHFAHRKRIYASDLTENERNLIYQLQNAMTVFVDERTLPETRESTEVFDLINWPKVYARRIIKFCKQIANFRILDTDDQLKILKRFYLQILLIRALFFYDSTREGYPVMEDENGTSSIFIKFQHSGLFKKQPEFNEFSVKFAHSIQAEMANDFTIRDLVIGQFLFSSTGLTSQEFVRQQYFIYCHLLRRYLEHKHGNINQATKKFQSLMNTLQSLDLAIEKCQSLFQGSDIDISQFDHFLVELYGMVQ